MYDDLRAQLLGELQTLLVRHKVIDDHLAHRDRELPRDWEDLATLRENEEVLEALDERARAEIDAIRVALDRMDQGTYNVCASCGGEIGEARLRAMPTTTLCIDCATSLDR